MLGVACVWVKANVPYSVDYVLRLQAMVARHLRQPYRFICLTDRPEAIHRSDIRTVPVLIAKGLPGWWAKVALFDASIPDALGVDRMLYLDLDSVVVADLSCVADYPAPFALVPPAGTFKGRGALRVVTRFNSSVMAWDPEETGSLYRDFDMTVTSRLWGDQDWIGERMPSAATMPAEWFPRLSDLNGHEPGEDAVVVLCKKPKNVIAAELHPWLRDAWGPAPREGVA